MSPDPSAECFCWGAPASDTIGNTYFCEDCAPDGDTVSQPEEEAPRTPPIPLVTRLKHKTARGGVTGPTRIFGAFLGLGSSVPGIDSASIKRGVECLGDRVSVYLLAGVLACRKGLVPRPAGAGKGKRREHGVDSLPGHACASRCVVLERGEANAGTAKIIWDFGDINPEYRNVHKIAGRQGCLTSLKTPLGERCWRSGIPWGSFTA